MSENEHRAPAPPPADPPGNSELRKRAYEDLRGMFSDEEIANLPDDELKQVMDVFGTCTTCGGRASFGAWDMPEYAVPRFCSGCGGLLGVDYE